MILGKYAEKYEAKGIITKIRKYKDNPENLKLRLKKTNIFKNIDIEKEMVETIEKKFEEIADKEIIFDKKIIFPKNDLVLIENKRKYPNHMPNEVKNFIEHSLYFINLYEKLKLLDKESEIHLLFIYDHYRNYNDEGQVVIELYKIINEYSEKLHIFQNKISRNNGLMKMKSR